MNYKFYAFKPLAKKENILYFNEYRITVLTERLFRIEKNGFTDKPSQTVFYRNLLKVSFSVVRKKDYILLKTAKVKLKLCNVFEESLVCVNGKWEKLNNDQNLMGTYRTLDMCDGDFDLRKNEPIKLGYGVCSLNGVAVLDDSDTLLFDGETLVRRAENSSDVYVFAYGKEYRESVRALLKITGNTPMIPRYALGNWWSRYYAYTDRSYLTVLDGFAEKDIPFTVATIDMDWHYSTTLDHDKKITESGKDTEYFGGTKGWTGYSWNKNLFPDYKDFLKKIKERNYRITLNLHPADGVRWFEDCYKKVAKTVGVDASTEQKIDFDLTDPKFVKAYFENILNPYEKAGVDFWWIDWQQGTKSKMEGLDPLFLLNHYQYADINRKQEGIILSRFSGIGAHRYPLGFSGDTSQTFKSLAYLPYFTATATNCGYGWWSHDIGGHHMGERNSCLYIRFLQYGAFSPINRLHCTNHEMISKDPAVFVGGIGELAGEILRFRHSMIPMLYTASYTAHTTGQQLIEPLYYVYPDAKQAYAYKNEYFFAEQMLVCPITTDNVEGIGSVKAWIPEGIWTDYFTGCTYRGGKEIELHRFLNSIPVLVKEGGIIVRSGDKIGNASGNPHKLLIEIFAGKGEYTLYEDGEGKRAFTTIKTKRVKNRLQVEIKVAGDLSVLPEDRRYEIVFRNCDPNAKVKADVAYERKYTNELTILGGVTRDMTLWVEMQPKTEIEIKKKELSDILARMEGTNRARTRLYNAFVTQTEMEGVVQAIQASELTERQKDALLEICL